MTAMATDDGSSVQLGAVLAKAGEGSVYEVVGRADVVAKVFHATLSDLSEKLDKVAAMAATPPPGAIQSDGFVVLTWPQRVVSQAGTPAGYLMPRIDTKTAVEIHTLSNPFNRANPLPGAPQWTANATWAHLVNVAANLCLAVDVVHRVDAVIGDFQERNVLVSDTSQVTLVDCDSMQFTDARGRQFLCGVARPEFTAPELAAVNLRSQPRNKSSDLFALAVHIYQLLMGGNHPFMRGMWTASGEQPTALNLAQSGWWAGGPASPLATHPLAPPVSFLPADLVRLFVRAFTDGARDPATRPSAAEWRRALLAIRTAVCLGGIHQVSVATAACPWCAIDLERARRKRGTMLRGGNSADSQIISPIVDYPPLAADAVPAPFGVPVWSPPSGASMGAPRTPPLSNRRMPIVVALSVIAAIAVVAIGIAIGANTSRSGNQIADNAQNVTTPTSESYQEAPPSSELPSTTTELPATITELPPPTTSESPNGVPDATAQAINNAQVGDCIHVQNGAKRSDGSFDVTVSTATCESADATHKVIMRTDDFNNCPTKSWVRTEGYVPIIVLCLRTP